MNTDQLLRKFNGSFEINHKDESNGSKIRLWITSTINVSLHFYQYTERIITVTLYITRVHEPNFMDTTIKYHIFQIKSCGTWMKSFTGKFFSTYIQRMIVAWELSLLGWLHTDIIASLWSVANIEFQMEKSESSRYRRRFVSVGYTLLQDRCLPRDGADHWRYFFGDSFEFRLIFEFGDRPDAFCHRHRRRDDWRCLSDPTRPTSPLKSWLLYLSLCVPSLSLSLSLSLFQMNSLKAMPILSSWSYVITIGESNGSKICNFVSNL